jgi:hypothetical protein
MGKRDIGTEILPHRAGIEIFTHSLIRTTT